jgi:sugar lactone lactonase YvrE
MNARISRNHSLELTARRGVALCLLLGLAPTVALAVRARTISDSSWEEFRQGVAKGVAIGTEGSLRPGPEAVLLAELGARSAWAIAGDGRGGSVIASGDGGLILSRADGKDAKLVTRATLFDSEVFALASDGRGAWYAAGAPVGTVVKIPEKGETHTLFDVPEGVVFSLLARSDGEVFAGTGDRGRLYQISSSGEGRVLCESPDLTVRCLAWAPDGKIVAGTDGRGLLEIIDPQSGDIRILYEAEEREIVSVVPLPDGSILFGANPGTGGDGGDSPESGSDAPPADSGEHDPHGGKGLGAAVIGSPHPAVYRYSPDGSVRRIWSCPEKLLHALALAPNGAVYAATSGEATIYRLDPDGAETLLWRAAEQQVLSLWSDGASLVAGTGNPGRLYRLGPGMSEGGVFTAKPFDAGDLARWGQLRWNGEAGGGSVAAETRTGFTEPPDDSWSPWAAVAFDGTEGPVTSPPGRFLQWRLTLHPGADGAPSVRRVDVSAIGSNRPPQVATLRVSPDEPAYTSTDASRTGVTQVLPGGVQIDYSLPGLGGITVLAEDVPSWVRRVRSVAWEASDPDGDELRYTLEIREVGKGGFRVLVRDLADRAWSLDQGLLPDGVYELRLTATDEPANPVGSGLRDVRVSPPFRIDTEAPRVTEVRAVRGAGRIVEVRGVATDEASPLRRIDVSVDGEAFRPLMPDDGMLDSRRESFHGMVPLRPEQEGSWIVVRAQDAAGNRGSYRAWLEN